MLEHIIVYNTLPKLWRTLAEIFGFVMIGKGATLAVNSPLFYRLNYARIARISYNLLLSISSLFSFVVNYIKIDIFGVCARIAINKKDKNQCVCNIVILYKTNRVSLCSRGRWLYNIQGFLSCPQFRYQMCLFHMMRPI